MRLLPARVRWFLGRPRTRACAQEDKRGVGNASERYRDSGGLDLSRSSRPRLRFQSARPCSRSCVLRRGGLGAAMEISGPLALWRSASTHQLVRPVGVIRYPAVDDTASSGRAPSPQRLSLCRAISAMQWHARSSLCSIERAQARPVPGKACDVGFATQAGWPCRILYVFTTALIFALARGWHDHC